MTHQNAVEQMSVERYLLGELSGESRDHFEAHLFDCTLCATDLKDGVTFLNGVKIELESAARIVSQRKPSHLAWLWSPQLLAPALAACLAIILYQSAVLLPRAHTQLAALEVPSVLMPLTLANAGARGAVETLPQVTALRGGFYLLAVDIPPAPGATAYRCSLHAADGLELWHILLTPRQIQDAVSIQVPVGSAPPGVQELRVQSVSSGDGTLVALASYKYTLTLK